MDLATLYYYIDGFEHSLRQEPYFSSIIVCQKYIFGSQVEMRYWWIELMHVLEAICSPHDDPHSCIPVKVFKVFPCANTQFIHQCETNKWQQLGFL